MSLDNLINTKMSTDLTDDLIHKWDHIVSVIGVDDIYSKEIELSEADKYTFDFNGLLLSLDIPQRYWFAHVRLNNFKSASEYDGRTTIYLLDSDYMQTIFNSLSNNSITV